MFSKSPVASAAVADSAPDSIPEVSKDVHNSTAESDNSDEDNYFA